MITAEHTSTTKGRYTLLRDYEGHWGIIEVHEAGARWLVRPDALMFEWEVRNLFNRITQEESA